MVEKAWGSPSKTSYARIASGISGTSNLIVGRPLDPEEKRKRQYWERRRALRIRPVGDGQEEQEITLKLVNPQ